jgi:AAA domain-containing protein/bifunctional DNA primase/polymerase-like protein/primase-like protein/IclR-like helix-turn-helix domain-containing protein
MKSLRYWAIKYAQAGFPVLPLEPNGKGPLGSSTDSPFHSDMRRPLNGKDDATTDIKKVGASWKRWPNANIGICPRPGEGILDVDPRKGGKRVAAMVPTLESITGRGDGGGHFFYTGAPTGTLKLVGIDFIRNGYVVAPPSIHPDTGKPYKWVGGFDPTRIQPWPKGLVTTDKAPAPKLNGDHLPLDPSQVAWCLERIRADEYEDWIKVGQALKADYGQDSLDQWVEWSRSSKKFKGERDCAKKWDSFKNEGVTTRTLKFMAESASEEKMPGPDPAEEFVGEIEVDIFDETPRTKPKPSGPRSGQELLMKKFKPIRWAVKNILPEGLFLLVAPPKVGKSWLALQIALAVGSGGKVLGEQAEQGGCLVLALEDNDRRLKSRLEKLGATFEDVADVYFETVWPRVDMGGVKQLDQWLKEHPASRYVVIDVLERFRARRSAKDNAYTADYDAITALKPLCDKYHVTILIVHHTRKMEADDPLDMVSGTQGLAGGADGVLILKKQRGQNEGELHVMGRDLEQEGAYVVVFNRDTCHWEMVGATNTVSKSTTRREILEVLRKAGKGLKPAEIATFTGRSRQAVFQLLNGLIEEGLVCNENGTYTPI